jgi:hypothetical protein
MAKLRRLAATACFASLVLAAAPLLAERPSGGFPATYSDKEKAWQDHQALSAGSLFGGLSWRSIGPSIQGGRVVDIEAVPGKPYSFYVAYATGGLWRTDNNGVTFEPLWDDQPTPVIGDIAVDPKNPERVWVGTGENNSSRSTYGGMGVFRSDDSGKTFRYVGLGDSDRIGRILVDPRDGNRVYVAALGKLYTPGGPRGLHRTKDGGATWELVLDTGSMFEFTGAIDLVQNPKNPDVIYVSTWQRSRRPWDFVEGGPGSGIYKSADGGDSWKRLEGGFPQGGDVGRIGLAIAASQPDIVYAAVDMQTLLPEADWDLGDGAVSPKRLRKMTKAEFLAQDPEAIEDFLRDNDLDPSYDAKKLIAAVEKDELTLADLLAQLDDANANLFNVDIRGLEVYRSSDAGATWKRTHDRPLQQVTYNYGYYFGQIRVAPDDPNRVYCVGVPIITSGDGGKTWTGANGRDVHVDHHAPWIDPGNSKHLLLGNDGGVDASYDGGKTWIKLDNQPLGQFYAVTVDNEKPYNVYGGLQDNGSLKGSSRSRPGLDEDWQFIGGGDGMQVQVDTRDNTTYAGFQFGFYFRTGPAGRGSVRPRAAFKEKALRYNWQTPILLSSHNADVFYFGAEKVYRSLDKGETFKPISPELTKAKQRGDVPYATLTTLAESPLQFGLLWAGSDDGQVWVTVDGGVDWADVGEGLPKDRWVSRVEASKFEKNRVYVSLNGYRDDDLTPYVYRSEDLGRTWVSIAAGLPAAPVNVVREDPVNQEVLYVGTDRGAYVSLDRGKSWQTLHEGLPIVPVHDLVVHPRDRELVAGTHGRSVYVIDALPIQELPKLLADGEKKVEVFPLENVQAQRFWYGRRDPWFYEPVFDPKVEIPFYSAQDGKAVLSVLDGDGRVLRRLEKDVKRGVATFEWDLLLDEKLALAAEEAVTAKAAKEKAAKEKEAAKAKKEKAKKEGKVKGAKEEAVEAKPPELEKGVLAKTPWAEALRLGQPLYVTPGSYKVEIKIGEASAQTALEIDKPEPRKPRQKAKPKIRGEKDDDHK